MDCAFITAAARDVKSLIAHFILENAGAATKLGTVTLAPHQSGAVVRIQRTLAEFHGAFLCDAVGSGKTYIGLAVAQDAVSPLIVAPAALRGMWLSAIEATESRARFVSLESLSRSAPRVSDCDMLIVDEAHHFRNCGTKRYGELARAARGRPILLMTATPIHNSRRDFENLASLFLGARARHLSAQEITRLVIRRDKTRVTAPIPEVMETQWMEIGDDAQMVRDLFSLPPPVAPRDTGEAGALAAHGLVRQWASSEAALAAALKRRRTRGAALESALEAGDHPSLIELRSWTAGDEAVQLGLAGILSPDTPSSTDELLAAVRAHLSALDCLWPLVRANHALDDERAAHLQEILLAHPGARVVAFASYEATVITLFDRLLHSNRMACLTSKGARVAGGRISRADAIRQFDPASKRVPDSDRIDLLLTTDLLSEGVNLQVASVIVHLDLPWTAARLEQRVGRAARVGSAARRVFVYGFKPPPSAERALRASALVSAKWIAAAATIGADGEPGLDTPRAKPESSPESHETLRALLATWKTRSPRVGRVPLVGAVQAQRAGFLAVVGSGSDWLILGGGEHVTDSPSEVSRLAASAHETDVVVSDCVYKAALESIDEWLSIRKSAQIAGLDDTRFLRSRRKVFAGVDAFTANSSPICRIRNAQTVARIRAAAAGTLGAEDERTILSLEQFDSGETQEWLASVAASAKRSSVSKTQDYSVRALLLLIPTTAPSP
ncbi:MAG: hypothetical protein H0W63_05865 [Gemmatimonadaceae bacterium]|nr:hypothetical protein [Gemmatimonadaceae bacterium]